MLFGPIFGGGWGAVSVYETCYAVVLTIFIFTWTLSGFSSREADRKKIAADHFARAIETRSFGQAPLDAWHRQKLATVLGVSEGSVEDELLLWLIDQPGVQGPREALVITHRLWFLRLVGRGRGGHKVFDLSTGERLA